MGSTSKKQAVFPNIKLVEKYMEERVGVGTSFDIGFRELTLLKTNISMYYVTGLCDTLVIQEILQKLIEINDFESNRRKLPEIIENRLVHQQVEPVKTMDEAVDQILSGLIAIFIDGYREAFIIDVRSYPGRSPEEPDTERVVRGSRDGYTENIIENTALTRRRLRDTRLRHEMMKVGERSKMDVCISYIEDIANPDLVGLIKQKVEEIEIDGVVMADKGIEEFLVKQRWNQYPLVRYTERPDVVSTHLLEGHVVMFVDTSPSAVIFPTTFFHHLQHAEEYRQTPTVGTFIRITRFIGVLASMYLLSLWLLFSTDPSLLPKELSFIGPNEVGNIPIVLQIILAEIGIEFLRMAAIHTPTPLSTALGLIAAVLIGQIAIDVGLFSPEVILYVAVSAVGTYVTPSYELSIANKLFSILLVIITGIFGVFGFTVGITLHILLLLQLRSLETPYLWPFIPFNANAMLNIIFRIPQPYTNKRPSVVHPSNNYRQPEKKS